MEGTGSAGDKRDEISGLHVEKNGKAEKHIQGRIRKAAVAMKRTWHIGERLFKEEG